MVEVGNFFAQAQKRSLANSPWMSRRREWTDFKRSSKGFRSDDKTNSSTRAASSTPLPADIDVYDRLLATFLSKTLEKSGQNANKTDAVSSNFLYPGILTDILSISRWPTIDNLLTAWSALEDDWDDCEAVAPCPQQIKVVKSFIAKCQYEGIKEPRGYITSDTEIGFHWDGFRKASVSFLLEGKFLAFCPREDEADVKISGPFDIATCSTTLFSALRRIK